MEVREAKKQFRAIEDIEIWQRACRLAMNIYTTVDNSELKKKWSLGDQMTRAAVSIPSNIAEGYERNSPNEFVRFLRIAKGSCAELRTQLYLAKGLGFITAESVESLLTECKRLSGMIQNLIGHVRSIDTWKRGQVLDG